MTRYENDSCARICGPVLSCVSVWWNGHLENDASHPFTFTLEGLPLGRTRKRGVYRRRQLLALADLVSVRGVKLMSPRCAVRLYCLHDFSMTWFSLMMESTATVETGSKKFESIEQRLLRTILATRPLSYRPNLPDGHSTWTGYRFVSGIKLTLMIWRRFIRVCERQTLWHDVTLRIRYW